MFFKVSILVIKSVQKHSQSQILSNKKIGCSDMNDSRNLCK